MPCHWHIMCSPSNSKLSNFESLQVQDKKMIVKKHPKHSGHESFVHAFRHAAFVHDLHLRGSPSSTSLSLAHLNEDAIILHHDETPVLNPLYLLNKTAYRLGKIMSSTVWRVMTHGHARIRLRTVYQNLWCIVTLRPSW